MTTILELPTSDLRAINETTGAALEAGDSKASRTAGRIADRARILTADGSRRDDRAAGARPPVSLNQVVDAGAAFADEACETHQHVVRGTEQVRLRAATATRA